MSNKMKPQILIGAASSGSGKTTFTLGLLRLLRERGLAVQPFKCGPDYIDTQYHSLAAGRDSVNLDTFMCGEEHLKEVYSRYGAGSDVNVVEGVMGLFDGYSRMEGSSARIAQILDVPVLLVINAKSCAYSVAPVIYGYKNFCKGVNIAGVVFNMVGSESHYNILKDACADLDVPVLGYIPKNNDIEIPSRHLGLSLDGEYLFDEFAGKVARVIEEHVDVERLLEIFTVPMHEEAEADEPAGNLLIAVAKDAAFNFIYRENLRSLGKLGRVKFFSPMEDEMLPECDLLYLPGGYPELFLEALENNERMRNDIAEYIESGGKAIAECGGMMYLCSSITDEHGNEYRMCGVLPQKATMEGKRLHIGYRRFEYAGNELSGHEFHYSKVVCEDNPEEGILRSAAKLYNAQGMEVPTPLYRYKNLIAGYTHLYWGNSNIIDLF